MRAATYEAWRLIDPSHANKLVALAGGFEHLAILFTQRIATTSKLASGTANEAINCANRTAGANLKTAAEMAPDQKRPIKDEIEH